MKIIGKKTIRQEDAKFKITKNGSNESIIYIDPVLAKKLNLIQQQKITFVINEENILRALAFVFQFKHTLYNNDIVELNQEWFSNEYGLIRKHFEISNKYTCDVKFSKNRFYLESLHQASGLNLRNILIENYFEFEFIKDQEFILIKINYSENEIQETNELKNNYNLNKGIICNKKLTEFSLSAIVFLKNEFGDFFINDNVEKFETKIGEFNHVGYKLPKYFKSVRVFGAFANDNIFYELLKSNERKRYHENSLNILGENNIYFTTEIEYNKSDKSSNLFFGDFKKFVEDYSKRKYTIEKIVDNYILYRIEDIKYKQKIYFGPPGSGKSYHIQKQYGYEWPRVTFHPELDYQGFIGAYKPTIIQTNNGVQLTYRFVEEVFIKAYCEAWKSRELYYLIIEEINRWNCAQIFGDIFQLLDRNNAGYSEYPISCSPDVQNHLKGELGKMERLDEYERMTKVKDFSRLILPNNFNILCTMNTSDQSLFPMDSAFKRRWEWQYIPINYKDASKFHVDLGDKGSFNWGTFIEYINEKIKDHTQSEDKQLGNRFVSPTPGHLITKEEFVSKVIFYLWSEIYKDEQGTGESIFYVDNETELSFSDFFMDGKVNTEIVRKFIDYNLLIGNEVQSLTKDISSVDEVSPIINQ